MLQRMPRPVRVTVAGALIAAATPLSWLGVTKGPQLLEEAAYWLAYSSSRYVEEAKRATEVPQDVAIDVVKGGRLAIEVADELGIPRGSVVLGAGAAVGGAFIAVGSASQALERWSAARSHLRGVTRLQLNELINGVRVQSLPLHDGSGFGIHAMSSFPITNLEVRFAVFPGRLPSGEPARRQDFFWRVAALNESGTTTAIRIRDGVVEPGEGMRSAMAIETVNTFLRGKPNQPNDPPAVVATHLEFDLAGGGHVEVQNRDGSIQGFTRLNERSVNLAQNMGAGWNR